MRLRVSGYSVYSVFVKHTTRGCTILIVYVDDMVISGSDSVGIQVTKAWLKSKLHIKDLGQPQHFLGIEVLRNRQGVYLSQKKYLLNMIEVIGLTHAKLSESPLKTGTKRLPEEGNHMEDASKHRRMVSKLTYQTVTRLDLSFAVSFISQFMQHPRSQTGKLC